MDDELVRIRLISNRLLSETPSKFHRSLFSHVDWQNRLISIKGARGTGKTTMLRQYAMEQFGTNPNALYVSFDHYWFKNHSPMEFVEAIYQQGVTHLFIDEVHHLQHWQTVIKNIYDFYPHISVTYSGSSLLKLDNREGDLSRRQMVYKLYGLSFREYLEFEGVLQFPPLSLDDLLKNHEQAARDISRNTRILPLFEKYLESGYYPYYKTEHSGYYERIAETVDKVLDSDFPAVEDVTPGTIRKTKKMMVILAGSCPQTPNMSELYRELETDRNQGLKMLSVLERAQLLSLVGSEKSTLKSMSRPEKIYCDNTNLMYALVSRPDIGTIRETFFVNQLRAADHSVGYPATGDFVVDSKMFFEIGGKQKHYTQIKDIPDSYLVVDNLEVGYGNRIPLWLFGFLY